MKKIAFVFVAAIVASVAVSMSSCKKGEAKDTTKVDTPAVEAPAVVEEPACCDSTAAFDSTAADSTAAPQA